MLVNEKSCVLLNVWYFMVKIETFFITSTLINIFGYNTEIYQYVAFIKWSRNLGVKSDLYQLLHRPIKFLAEKLRTRLAAVLPGLKPLSCLHCTHRITYNLLSYLSLYTILKAPFSLFLWMFEV